MEFSADSLPTLENSELKEFLPKLFLAFNDSKGKNYYLAEILLNRGLAGLFLKYSKDPVFLRCVCKGFYKRHKSDPFFVERVGKVTGEDDPIILHLVNSSISQTAGRLLARYSGINIDEEF